jgi:hypothetical protein
MRGRLLYTGGIPGIERKSDRREEECMLDILQLRIGLDEFDQLRLCQTRLLSEFHAAFTASGPEVIWPLATAGDTPFEERINVRGWFPLLDRIADEFLIFRPKGGCFYVSREGASYRVGDGDARRWTFLQFELNRLAMVPSRTVETRRAHSAN